MSDPFKKKRKIIRRRRLKGDELFNFLNQENYFEKDISEKDKRRILIEAGYAIPYKELSTEQITAFASELIRKDDKYQKFLDFKYQQISLEEQAGDYNFESEKYNSFYKNINRNKPSLDIKTSIYLIKDLDNHGVKIGMSNNIERRMREIKKQYKVDNIKLISYITLGSKEAAEIMEKELHNKFGSFKAYGYSSNRGHTSHEWFYLDNEKINLIRLLFSCINKKRVYRARKIERKKEFLFFFNKKKLKFYGENGLPLDEYFPIAQLRGMGLWELEDYYQSEEQKYEEGFPKRIEPISINKKTKTQYYEKENNSFIEALENKKYLQENKNSKEFIFKGLDFSDPAIIVLFFFFILPAFLGISIMAFLLWPLAIPIMIIFVFFKSQKNI